ncbi:hypothetical protein OsJ_10537 [Oryza sativa Japonica Group]|uniref:Uncharacterized protein n=1 Tax=Oryza sativa subsp. japonica TaxID=39947 RepID=B9F7W9_ORYSJ|nr:hypothetical protein OsJ_10537 [Oryza sativa Japonica Group]
MDDDIDSSCSTPFASAPSSPGRSPATGGGYFFSAPASPIHHLLLSSSSVASGVVSGAGYGGVGDAEFEFGGPGGPMISADELFHNGQIRPLTLPPLPDLDPGSDDDDGGGGDFRPGPVRGRELTLRSGSVHRRTRSMSPLRGASPRLKLLNALVPAPDLGSEPTPSHSAGSEEATPPVTASSRSSSSSSTSSSSSSSSSARGVTAVGVPQGHAPPPQQERARRRPTRTTPPPSPEKAWQFSALPQSEASSDAGGGEEAQATRGRARGGKGRRRSSTVAAAHERLYAARNRAQAEEMRRRTFLPYRQGLLGCLGFSSRGYGALHGFTKTLNPVFSR